jgi:hypothetical protein
VLWRRREPRRLDDIVRGNVVVHTKTKASIAGVLVGNYADCIALSRARLLSESAGHVIPLDGEVLIEHRNIDLVQAGVTFDDTDERALQARARGLTP